MEFIDLTIDNGIATIRLNRPPVNALNRRMQEEIRDAAYECSRRDEVRSVVIFGGDKAFAAGADIKEMEGMEHADMVRESHGLVECFSAVARIPKPTVAAVTGYALGGGCELALCADFRFVAENAILGQPEILLGIIPGGGGTQRLPRLVGPSRAKEIVFTGRRVLADEALAIGLADRVLPAADVYAASVEFLSQFSRGPAMALRAAKEAVDRGIEVDLQTGLEIERMAFAATFATQDRGIGMTSFREHGPGKAEFTGR
jgi:enoyl-CoA hydratase/carnithine racemase